MSVKGGGGAGFLAAAAGSRLPVYNHVRTSPPPSFLLRTSLSFPIRRSFYLSGVCKSV